MQHHVFDPELDPHKLRGRDRDREREGKTRVRATLRHLLHQPFLYPFSDDDDDDSMNLEVKQLLPSVASWIWKR